MLDGVSGDHITAPYNFLSILIRSLHWRTAAAELDYNARIYENPVWPNLLLHGLGPLLPNLSVRLRQRIRKYRQMPLLHDSPIKKEFANRMKVSERFEARARTMWEDSQDLGSMHSWSFTSGILPFFFEHAGRCAAMKMIETRHPFSDRRIVEFFLSLPLKMKTYSPLPKRVIRAGMKGILPEGVRCRTTLAHPGGSFLLSSLGHCSQLLEPDNFMRLLAPLYEYVNVSQLESERASWLQGTNRDGYALWQVLSLATWIRAKHLGESAAFGDD
jgi:asparagine synthase (glutamine-hydrolysing)